MDSTETRTNAPASRAKARIIQTVPATEKTFLTGGMKGSFTRGSSGRTPSGKGGVSFLPIAEMPINTKKAINAGAN